MDQTEKANALHDIKVINQLQKNYNFQDAKQAEGVLSYLNSKSVFRSRIGDAYARKLKILTEQSDDRSCMLCKRDADNYMICPVCQGKLDTLLKAFSVKTDSVQAPTSTQEVKKSITKEQLQNEKTKETATQIVNKTRKISNVILSKWKTFSLKKKIVIAVIALAVVSVIGGGIGGTSSSGKADSVESATKLVSKIYTTSDYEIKYMQQIQSNEQMYDVKVGSYCGDAWTGEMCDTYVFSVADKQNPLYTAVLWVNADGESSDMAP